MRKLLPIIILLAFCFSGFAQNPGSPDYLPVKRGFKIFKLGTPIKDYSSSTEFVSEDKDGDVKLYKVVAKTDPTLLSVGNSIKLDSIILNVYEGTIISIVIYVDEPYKEDFFRSLEAAYGKGHKDDPNTEKYTWHSYSDKAKIILTYSAEHKKGDSKGMALFQDVSIVAKKEQDRKNVDKKNIKDL